MTSTSTRVLILSYIAVVLFGTIETWSLNTILLSVPKFEQWNRKGTETGYSQLIEMVSRGVRKGMEECGDQFKWHLWNCPETPSTVLARKAVIKVNRETAFLHSIVSAGVMQAVTKSCTSGNQTMCSCVSSPKEKPDGDWQWGGCSDNVKFGERVARYFLKSMDIGRDSRSTAALRHNSAVGNKAVTQTMKFTCKCHGVCGSCTVRTCWKQVSDFKTTGDFLKRRYHKAVRVRQDGRKYRDNRARTPKLSKVSKRDLVYLDKSPNYCRLHSSKANARECTRPGKDAAKWERSSCGNICKKCGLKVRKVVKQVSFKCNCAFRWCCKVECQMCSKQVTRHYCK